MRVAKKLAEEAKSFGLKINNDKTKEIIMEGAEQVQDT